MLAHNPRMPLLARIGNVWPFFLTAGVTGDLALWGPTAPIVLKVCSSYGAIGVVVHVSLRRTRFGLQNNFRSGRQTYDAYEGHLLSALTQPVNRFATSVT